MGLRTAIGSDIRDPPTLDRVPIISCPIAGRPRDSVRAPPTLRSWSRALQQPADPRAPGNSEAAGFADPYTRYVMGVLFLVYVFSYVDRQLMAVLLQDIKLEFGLSDAQMGLL